MIQTTQRILDETGRICIPKQYCDAINIKSKAHIEVSLRGDCIVLRKSTVACRICGKTANMIEGFEICRPCAEKAAFLLTLEQ